MTFVLRRTIARTARLRARPRSAARIWAPACSWCRDGVRYPAGMEFLRKLNTFLAGQRRLMGGSIFFGLVFAASGLIPPLLIRQILVWAAEGRGCGM